MIDIYNLDFHGTFVNMVRNSGIKKYFDNELLKFAKDKTIIDLGAGSGILSLLAIKHGAKKVFVVENNPVMCQALKVSFAKFGITEKVVILNKDFIQDDLEEYFLQSDICVSEVINDSIFNNIAPWLLKKIKTTYPHVKMIPQDFQISANIIESDSLDEHINFNYDEDTNQILHDICLPMMILQPMKYLPGKIINKNILNSEVLISYDLDNNSVVTNPITIPADRKNKWLEIFWTIEENVIYNHDRQCEYIPLDFFWFDKCNTVSLVANKQYHKLIKG